MCTKSRKLHQSTEKYFYTLKELSPIKTYYERKDNKHMHKDDTNDDFSFEGFRNNIYQSGNLKSLNERNECINKSVEYLQKYNLNDIELEKIRALAEMDFKKDAESNLMAFLSVAISAIAFVVMVLNIMDETSVIKYISYGYLVVVLFIVIGVLIDKNRHRKCRIVYHIEMAAISIIQILGNRDAENE